MRLITLTKGFEAIVDDGLFESLNYHQWFAQGNDHRPARRLKDNEIYPRNLIYMYHQILQVFPWGLNGKVVDHINRNPLDNRLENLRIVTQAENMQNSITTIFKLGVSIDRTHNTWKAYIDYSYSFGTRRKNIGTFKTREEALAAVKRESER